MKVFDFNNGLCFGIENPGKRARIIVYKDGVENVCRMESVKNLEHFIRSNEKRIFKGRLQLHKNPAEIEVEVKGKIGGKIKIEDFTNYLEMIKE